MPETNKIQNTSINIAGTGNGFKYYISAENRYKKSSSHYISDENRYKRVQVTI